jgi:hypothetical protein
LSESKTSTLRVRDVLSAAPAVRELWVRTVGPAVVFVIEQEAPVRMLSNTLSDSEMRAILAWIRSSEDAQQFAAAYSDCRTQLEGGEDVEAVKREHRHQERLERGEPLRVGRAG